MSTSLKGKSILSIADMNRDQIESVLELAAQVKTNPERYSNSLSGRVMVMLFEKPSLRTRVTFESGIASMGGTGIYLAPDTIQMGAREPVRDVARNLSRWVSVIVARTFLHTTLEELKQEATIPVVNALSDWEHPCQALADFQTVRECFGQTPITFTFVGDGNNVCHSLLLAGAMLGYTMRVACPPGYSPNTELTKQAELIAEQYGGRIQISHDLPEMVKDAQVIYTDVWTSMGQEAEKVQRLQAFEAYQVNQQLIDLASSDVRVMHCLPAHREEEITNEVLEGPHSVVYDQAENRLHAQKSLLLHLLTN